MPHYTQELDEAIGRQVRCFQNRGRVFRFPARFNDRFEPVRLLAVGGFGVLLEAQDTKVFKRSVLIKCSLPEGHVLSVPNNAALHRFVEEGRERMIHERKMLLHGAFRGASGVPMLIDWFDDVSPMIRGPHQTPDGQTFVNDDRHLWSAAPYLVLSYLDGQELSKHCSTGAFQTKPLGSTRHVGFFLCNTLEVFHEPRPFGGQDISFIYQDLKPANVMVSRSEKMFCLIDLGSFAVVTPRGAGNVGMTTEGYGAPELRQQGRAACKPAVDVFSLGVVLKECLQRAKRTSGAVRLDIAAADLDVPDPWRDLLDRCTAADPTERFQSLPELRNALMKLPLE